MRAAGRTGNEECPVQMKLVAPPLYVLTTQTLDKVKGIQVLNDAIGQAEESIKTHKGSFKVKEAPRTVSERDDFLLQSKVSNNTLLGTAGVHVTKRGAAAKQAAVSLGLWRHDHCYGSSMHHQQQLQLYSSCKAGAKPLVTCSHFPCLWTSIQCCLYTL